jgi:hypothetical protein
LAKADKSVGLVFPAAIARNAGVWRLTQPLCWGWSVYRSVLAAALVLHIAGADPAKAEKARRCHDGYFSALPVCLGCFIVWFST